MIRTRRLRLTACAGLLALAACAAPQAAEQASPVAAAESAAFDQARSDALLGDARAAEAAGRTDEALNLYRQAALAWPDNADAWRGLSALAAAQGQAQEQMAADFMVERVTLYPSDALYVQREINRALDAWIAEQQAAPDANPVRISYADTLSDFYDWRYAMRGAYQPPRPFLNVQKREIPAVILSAGGLAGYIGSVAISGTTEATD